ncbi:MAG: hypothetical protein M1816_005609 [Peltula sp. TS41687]|nr:MAG: hypothetical protein M1816_005609 [Peltula sp. TS41687]
MGCSISKLLRNPTPEAAQPLEIGGPTNVVHVHDWTLPGIPADQLQMLHEKSMADAAMRFPKDKSDSTMERVRKHVHRASIAVRNEFSVERSEAVGEGST